MTKSIGVHQAKTHFSELIEEAIQGNDIVVTRRGEPVIRLVAISQRPVRHFGIDRGLLEIPDDFDAPLNDDTLNAFYASSS